MMQSRAKSISSNFIYNFIKTFASIIFPVITFAYASRILGVEGIGKLNFSKSIISYFSMFAMLGINHYGTREAAKLRNDRQQLSKFAHEMLMINGMTTIIVYIMLAVIISSVQLLQEYTILLWITSMSIFLTTMGMEWLYQGVEEYRYIAVRSIVFQVIAIIVMFITVKDEKDIVNYAVVCLLASSGSYVFNFLNCRRFIDFHYCGKYEIRKHIKPIIWLFAFVVSVGLYSILDSTMLGVFKGDKAVGIYSAAIKVNKMITSLICSLGVVLLPRLSFYYANKDIEKMKSMICKAYNFVFMLSVPACIGLYMLSDKIILLFSGDSFKSAGITMRLVCPILLLSPLNTLTNSQIFVPTNKEKKILRSTFTGAVTNFACNILFIPKWSENGAAVATVLAETAVMCVCLYHIRKEINLSYIFRKYFQYWIAAIPIIGISKLINMIKINYIVQMFFIVLCSVICYFSLLFLFKNDYFLMTIDLVSKKLHEKNGHKKDDNLFM